ncbi:hypothetical protein [Escherichia coli]|nr:hypothetical protein [Escherichia coli]
MSVQTVFLPGLSPLAGERCLGGGSAQPRNGLSPLARGTPPV